MIRRGFNLVIRESRDLPPGQLVNEFKHGLKPAALEFEFLLRNPYLHFNVRIDAAAAINCPPGVRALLLRSLDGFPVATLEVVIVKRTSAVFSLNQSTARRVVMARRQDQGRA